MDEWERACVHQIEGEWYQCRVVVFFLNSMNETILKGEIRPLRVINE